MSKLHVKRKPTYRIRCATGCVMPLPGALRIAQGGIRPQVFTPETVIEVEHSAFVVRRIAAGDFVEVAEQKMSKRSK